MKSLTIEQLRAWNGKVYGNAIYVNRIKTILNDTDLQILRQVQEGYIVHPKFPKLRINIEFYCTHKTPIKFNNPDEYIASSPTKLSKLDVVLNTEFKTVKEGIFDSIECAAVTVTVYDTEIRYMCSKELCEEIKEDSQWAYCLNNIR